MGQGYHANVASRILALLWCTRAVSALFMAHYCRIRSAEPGVVVGICYHGGMMLHSTAEAHRVKQILCARGDGAYTDTEHDRLATQQIATAFTRRALITAFATVGLEVVACINTLAISH